MKEITLETKIADLLNDYDDMKNILIGINPKFKKLNNPVLKRTLGRVASIRQAAVVGGMNPMDLVDQLRKAVGQEPICEDCEIKTDNCVLPKLPTESPEWIRIEPKYSVNANELLDAEKNPLGEVRKLLHKMHHGEVMTLAADFMPEPLIEEFHKDGHETFTIQEGENSFKTYIKK
jgi:uncharacterized protein (DUF2249 family)